jgi:hypothetical protein
MHRRRQWDEAGHKRDKRHQIRDEDERSREEFLLSGQAGAISMLPGQPT